jgi:vanillate O-demethylase monooxygenase subunit
MENDGYLRSAWYAAATSPEIGRTPFARTVCDEPMVFFRRANGSIAALSDRCPHRLYALSKGEIIGDDIQCGYHGIRFNGGGVCTLIPFQREIPRGFAARAFPVIEKHALIFVWMGDPAKADPTLLPDFKENDSAGWTAVHGYHYVRANYELLIDNLVDLTHLPTVHKGTLAGPGVHENPFQVEFDDHSVRAKRVMRNVDPAPVHRTIRTFPGKIDRSQELEFRPPVYVHIKLGAIPAGSNEPLERPHHVVINSLTPETQRSTHYFWSVARWMNLDDPEVSRKLKEMNQNAFDQDQAVLEVQQAMIESDKSHQPLANLEEDKATAAVRRLMRRKRKEEIQAGRI